MGLGPRRSPPHECVSCEACGVAKFTNTFRSWVAAHSLCKREVCATIALLARGSMPRARSRPTPPAPGPDSIGGRLAAAIRDWPVRPLSGWSIDDAIHGLSALSQVHVDTINRILDGRTLNPQSAKLRAVAAKLGVSESWLRRGQEELSFTSRPSIPRNLQRVSRRTANVGAPTRTALAEILAEIDLIPSESTRVRALRAAADAMIRSVVEDGEVLTTAYGTIAELDTWLAADYRRARAETNAGS